MPTTTTEAMQTEPKGYELVRSFLAQSGRAIDKVLGDGNCLFWALAKQLNGSADKHIELRRMIMNFEANNAHIFAQLCRTINCTSFSEHVETRRKVFTWGTTLEILATASLFRVDIFEATDSLTPGKVKWLKYSPFGYENLSRQEDADDFNGRNKPWLEIVYIGSSHFDSVKPLSKGKILTRPQLEVKHYEVDLT